ncbi:MAG: hypothetical protein LBT81_05485 [Helicobacteraceae bacterium]|jgi:TRAP-type C4-dicarboxylate transport system permease small subunit|nr:hypothetical protein [Helicobacteraceae bacterium]
MRRKVLFIATATLFAIAVAAVIWGYMEQTSKSGVIAKTFGVFPKSALICYIAGAASVAIGIFSLILALITGRK